MRTTFSMHQWCCGGCWSRRPRHCCIGRSGPVGAGVATGKQRWRAATSSNDERRQAATASDPGDGRQRRRVTAATASRDSRNESRRCFKLSAAHAGFDGVRRCLLQFSVSPMRKEDEARWSDPMTHIDRIVRPAPHRRVSSPKPETKLYWADVSLF